MPPVSAPIDGLQSNACAWPQSAFGATAEVLLTLGGGHTYCSHVSKLVLKSRFRKVPPRSFSPVGDFEGLVFASQLRALPLERGTAALASLETGTASSWANWPYKGTQPFNYTLFLCVCSRFFVLFKCNDFVHLLSGTTGFTESPTMRRATPTMRKAWTCWSNRSRQTRWRGALQKPDNGRGCCSGATTAASCRCRARSPLEPLPS